MNIERSMRSNDEQSMRRKVLIYGRDDLTKVKSWLPGYDRLVDTQCIQCGLRLFNHKYHNPWSWGFANSKLCKKCYKQRAEIRRPLGFRPYSLPTPEEFKAIDSEVAKWRKDKHDEDCLCEKCKFDAYCELD